MPECTHSHYKDNQHMTSRAALQALKAGKIRKHGNIIDKCSKCGANIRWARIVHVTLIGQK